MNFSRDLSLWMESLVSDSILIFWCRRLLGVIPWVCCGDVHRKGDAASGRGW